MSPEDIRLLAQMGLVLRHDAIKATEESILWGKYPVRASLVLPLIIFITGIHTAIVTSAMLSL
jgi:hypothetical protein